MKRIILAIALLLFIVSNIKSQEWKEMRIYKNGCNIINTILDNDSIKFSESGSSRWLHYLQNGNEVTLDISEIDSITFATVTNTYSSYFPGANTADYPTVEIDYMGEKILCNYVDGLYIIDGDIIIKDDNIENNTDTQDNTILKAAAGWGFILWPEGKVYYDPVSAGNFPAVGIALKYLSDLTHLKFIPIHTFEAKVYIIGMKNYGIINFCSSDRLSGSQFGMRKGTQNLYLLPDEAHRDVLHEIGHAICLIHEHQRYNRDLDVIIDKDNLDSIYYEDWFSQYWMRFPTEDSYPSRIDFSSVMMYECTAGSINGKPTIWRRVGLSGKERYPKPPETKISVYDQYLINKVYPSNASPDVMIYAQKQPTANSCKLTAELIYEGNPKMTEYGICYKEKSGGSNILKPSTSPLSTGTAGKYGIYECELTNLKPSTEYEARAYIKQNGQPVLSDNVVSFKTEPDENPDWVLINGVKWATRNVGAQTPEGSGNYYQWNKGTTDFLLYNDYYNSNYWNSTTWLPANDPSPVGYRVPTLAEIQSLTNTTYVSYVWTTQYGVIGGKFTDRATGKSIFLPAAGFRDYSNGALILVSPLYGVVTGGSYWSSTRNDSNDYFAYYLDVYSGGAYWDSWYYKSFGFPVRPVKDY